MTYAITYSWERGQYSAWMLNKSLVRLNVKHVIVFDHGQYIDPMIAKDLHSNGTIITYKTGFYGGHNGWKDTMKKVDGYRVLNKLFKLMPNDWVLDMDDDTYMASDAILKQLNNDIDIAGILHRPKYETKIGLFGHMSGACMCIRGEMVLKLIAQGDEFWNKIKSEYEEYSLMQIFDSVITYACVTLGAVELNLPEIIDMDVSAEDHFRGIRQANFIHFNSVFTQFMGEKVPRGKHDVPMVLYKKGLI